MEKVRSRDIWRLAWPIVAANTMQIFYHMADLFWVGRLGETPLAALAAATFAVWGILSLGEALSAGVQGLSAQARGGQRPVEEIHIVASGFFGILPFAFFTTGCALWGLPTLFHLLGTSPLVSLQGASYLRIILFGSPLTFALGVTTAAFYARGNSRLPTTVVGISLILNILLDPLFIFYFEGGVAGAAWATILSQGIALVSCLWFLPIRREVCRALLAPGLFRKWTWKVLKVGLPLSLNGVLFSCVYMWLTRYTAHFGAAAIAALGVGQRIEGVAYFIQDGFGRAAATAVGREKGAGRPKEALRAGWISFFLGGIPSLVWGIGMILGARSAFLFLAPKASPEAVSMGISYLLIMGPLQIFQAAEIILEGAFVGLGWTRIPAIGTMTVTLSRIPLAFLFAFIWSFGPLGIWGAIGLTCLVRGLWMGGLWVSVGPKRAALNLSN